MASLSPFAAACCTAKNLVQPGGSTSRSYQYRLSEEKANLMLSNPRPHINIPHV